MLLYGISLIYGFTGTTEFAAIAKVAGAGGVGIGLIFGLVFLDRGPGVQGLRRAVPYVDAGRVRRRADADHRLLRHGRQGGRVRACSSAPSSSPFPRCMHQWQQIIVVVSVLSMALGAVAAIGQTNIKRLMAYSSIGHMGYALLGLGGGHAMGVQGMLVYLAFYARHQSRHVRLHPGDAARRRSGGRHRRSCRAWRARSRSWRWRWPR